MRCDRRGNALGRPGLPPLNGAQCVEGHCARCPWVQGGDMLPGNAVKHESVLFFNVAQQVYTTSLHKMLCLGIEGSANKVGVGIVRDDGTILSNPRKTYEASLCRCHSHSQRTQIHHATRARLSAARNRTPPPGMRTFAATHQHTSSQQHVLGLVQQALEEARVEPKDIHCIAYTKVCMSRHL